jgi:hypothetical protein
MRGSNLNIGVTMKRKKAIKSEQHEPSNFKTPLNINHAKNDSICGLKVQEHDEFLTPNSMAFSCIFCHRKFSSKRALGGHRRVHKTERENHHQKNNKVVTMKGKEIVQSKQYQHSSYTMPIYIDLTTNDLRGHQKSHKREREIHDQENKNNNYKKVVTMKGKEVVKFEQYQHSNSMILVPIIDLTNNESKSFSCKICNRSFSSARALGGHKKAHKHKPTLAKHPQEMENFSSIHGIKIEDISIKLEDNVGESSINVDKKSNSILHKSTAVATCGHYHHIVKEEPIELDLSLKL